MNDNDGYCRISKVSTHSKCDVCLGLDQFRRKCKTQAELDLCNNLKKQHTTKYVNANIEVQNYIQKSITFPKDFVSFQIDGMDNREILHKETTILKKNYQRILFCYKSGLKQKILGICIFVDKLHLIKVLVIAN